MKIVFTNSDMTIDDTNAYNISESKEEDTTETEEVVDDTSNQEEEDMGTEDNTNKLSQDELEALRDGKAITCPECGSTNINIHDNGESYFCTDCEYSWDVRDADDDGIDDDADDYIDSMVEELDESYQLIGNTYILQDGSSVYVISNEGSSFEVLDIDSTDRYTIQESVLLSKVRVK
jgi:hypothetical protein